MGVPEHLMEEQRAVEAEIRRAFRGVTRVGGVSWSEADGEGLYRSDEERKLARARDLDTCWEELVDDPAWKPEPGVGGLGFVDAVGFRYYIAAVMIRCARAGVDEGLAARLEFADERRRDLTGAMDEWQHAAVARFVRFMMAVYAARGDDVGERGWRSAYEFCWNRWDEG